MSYDTETVQLLIDAHVRSRGPGLDDQPGLGPAKNPGDASTRSGAATPSGSTWLERLPLLFDTVLAIVKEDMV